MIESVCYEFVTEPGQVDIYIQSVCLIPRLTMTTLKSVGLLQIYFSLLQKCNPVL